MKARIYKWHRNCSIIIAIPVMLWALSGFMHPLMTNIKPAIAAQKITAVPVDSQRIRMSLAKALAMHHMDSIANVRLVHIDTNWFWQVQPLRGAVPVYLSCTTGSLLAAGDWLYAQYLARQFLEGSGQHTMGGKPGTRHEMAGMSSSTPQMAGMPSMPEMSEHSAHDCCGAATDFVLNPVKGSKVANVSMLHDFDAEYKSINRLLPVYRVSFDRADGIRIYVETTQDRYAFAMDKRRAVFDEIFRYIHLYAWLDWLGKGRIVVVAALALLALFTSGMGIYIFFVTRRPKKNSDNKLVRSRRSHRVASMIAVLFTLMWTFSGAWHALAKFREDDRAKYSANDHYAAGLSDSLDVGRLLRALGKPVFNISLASFNGRSYARVVEAAGSSYVDLQEYSVLPDGDRKYATWLAGSFGRHALSDTLGTAFITGFGDEYNFTDKRLPVWRVDYTTNGNERWYVETSTGVCASYMNDAIAKEGWSFSVFHKHHFMDWGGKAVRDASTMFWAFAQVVMVTVGLILYFRKRARRYELTPKSWTVKKID